MDCTNNNAILHVIYGDATLGLKGSAGDKEFHYIFSYSTGGLESLSVQGKEWLYRTPRPTFWRATTDNDRGNKFSDKSSMWLAADMFCRCVGAKVSVDGKEINLPIGPENNKYSDAEVAKSVEILYVYEATAAPGMQVEVAYEVNCEGNIRVRVHYHGADGLAELPVFGFRMIMPSCAEKYVYEGLSGETYPDRKAGGVEGVYEVQGLPVTPYLVPQDCGVHMDTKRLSIYRGEELRFELDGLAFSCLPYTACELENATHMEELPPARRTVLCIYGAVRGVGGIDSWGADVEPAYHISSKEDIEYSFTII